MRRVVFSHPIDFNREASPLFDSAPWGASVTRTQGTSSVNDNGKQHIYRVIPASCEAAGLSVTPRLLRVVLRRRSAGPLGASPQSAWRRIQNWGEVSSSRESRFAVSVVIRLLSRSTSFRRWAEILRRRAASTSRNPSGLKNSSRSISPREMAGPGQAGFLVFDADFVGMATLPPKCHAILIIAPNAVLSEPRTRILNTRAN